MTPTALCSRLKTWISSSPIRKTGTLSKNLTVQSNKVIYQIQSDRPDYTLRNAQVTVCENAKGEVTILYKNKPLAYTIFHKPTRQAEVVDTKTLDRPDQDPQTSGSRPPLASAMATTSTANPSRRPFPMAQTEIDWPVSLSLSAKNWAESKRAEPFGSAQSSASCRRSGRSPALPYPPHECHESIISSYPPLRKGDISTLQNRGHFYFALTWLTCLDRKFVPMPDSVVGRM